MIVIYAAGNLTFGENIASADPFCPRRAIVERVGIKQLAINCRPAYGLGEEGGCVPTPPPTRFRQRKGSEHFRNFPLPGLIETDRRRNYRQCAGVVRFRRLRLFRPHSCQTILPLRRPHRLSHRVVRCVRRGFSICPIGGWLFEWIGDSIGRKRALVLSITMMAVPCFPIGIIPTYALWEIAAAVLLVILSMLQGVAVGGEYTSSIVFLAEHAPQNRCGFSPAGPSLARLAASCSAPPSAQSSLGSGSIDFRFAGCFTARKTGGGHVRSFPADRRLDGASRAFLSQVPLQALSRRSTGVEWDCLHRLQRFIVML